MVRRTSPIWAISKDKLEEVVLKSKTITQILSYFNLENKGGNFVSLKKRLNEDNINYDHIKNKSIENQLSGLQQESIPLELILVEQSSYNRFALKKRLLKTNILNNICSICGQLPEWNNKPLSLQLDHINGVSNDNRIENLRILCPHCHSQTDNFAGKHNKKIKQCIECGIEISKTQSNKCKSCYNLSRRGKNEKIDWVDMDTLKQMVRDIGYEASGRKLGVCGKSVKKRIKKYG